MTALGITSFVMYERAISTVLAPLVVEAGSIAADF